MYTNLYFKIKRFDGESEWYQDYELPYEKGKTILWVLTMIREQLDPTLVFTSACRHAICGSCAIRINDNAFLVCKTSLDEVLETFQTNRLVFEPLNNFEVIKDLAVAWEPKMEKMEQVKPWLIPSEEEARKKGLFRVKRTSTRLLHRRIVSYAVFVHLNATSSQSMTARI